MKKNTLYKLSLQYIHRNNINLPFRDIYLLPHIRLAHKWGCRWWGGVGILDSDDAHYCGDDGNDDGDDYYDGYFGDDD